MEYHSMKELFAVADVEKCSPGIIACRVEAEESGKSYEQVWDRMKYTIPVFREAIRKGLADTSKSASGLVGGDGSRLFNGNMRFMSPSARRRRPMPLPRQRPMRKCTASWPALRRVPAASCPLSFRRWGKR